MERQNTSKILLNSSICTKSEEKNPSIYMAIILEHSSRQRSHSFTVYKYNVKRWALPKSLKWNFSCMSAVPILTVYFLIFLTPQNLAAFTVLQTLCFPHVLWQKVDEDRWLQEMRLNLYGAGTLQGVLKWFGTLSDKQISTQLNQTWPNSNLNPLYLQYCKVNSQVNCTSFLLRFLAVSIW